MRNTLSPTPRVDIWHAPEIPLSENLPLPRRGRWEWRDRQIRTACDADRSTLTAGTSRPVSLRHLLIEDEGEPLSSETPGLARALGVLQ